MDARLAALRGRQGRQPRCFSRAGVAASQTAPTPPTRHTAPPKPSKPHTLRHPQGSVPTANDNHPYTIELESRLEQALGRDVDVTNGGG